MSSSDATRPADAGHLVGLVVWALLTDCQRTRPLASVKEQFNRRGEKWYFWASLDRGTDGRVLHGREAGAGFGELPGRGAPPRVHRHVRVRSQEYLWTSGFPAIKASGFRRTCGTREHAPAPVPLLGRRPISAPSPGTRRKL